MQKDLAAGRYVVFRVIISPPNIFQVLFILFRRRIWRSFRRGPTSSILILEDFRAHFAAPPPFFCRTSYFYRVWESHTFLGPSSAQPSHFTLAFASFELALFWMVVSVLFTTREGHPYEMVRRLIHFHMHLFQRL